MSAESERVLSVYELAHALKKTVETATAGVWVEGEVGRLQKPGSGHVYFTMKDEQRDATIDCVIYKREAVRYAKLLNEGARVQLLGRATFYPPRGRLQWVADAVRPAGQGALLVALERLKEKLQTEGLFDAARKRALPTDPTCVGVVTSKTGAAFSDIVSVARRRGPVRIVLSPAVVQGDGAAISIVAALDRLERLPALDVIILGRGGGSKEDLMAFNDERVVRRVAACRVPVVSAVGHEVDVSLCDSVADARAATPSQAAELVVPDARARHQLLVRLERHLGRVAQGIVGRAALDVARLGRRLGDPRVLLAERQQGLDELHERARACQRLALTQRRRRLLELEGRLAQRHPRAVLSSSRAELWPLSGRLRAALRRSLDRSGGNLRSHARALGALSPLAILGRGYALAFDSEGRAIREAAGLRPGDPISVRVAHGAFTARVEKVRSAVAEPGPFEHELAQNEDSGS